MHLRVLQWRVLLNAAGPSPYPPSHLQGDCIWGALAVLGDMKAAGALTASLAAPTAGQAQHRQCPGNTGASPKAAALPRPRCATAAHACTCCQASCYRDHFQTASANTQQDLGSNVPSGLLVIIVTGMDPGEGAAAALYPSFSLKLDKAAGVLWKGLPLSLNSHMWGIGSSLAV